MREGRLGGVFFFFLTFFKQSLNPLECLGQLEGLAVIPLPSLAFDNSFLPDPLDPLLNALTGGRTGPSGACCDPLLLRVLPSVPR